MSAGEFSTLVGFGLLIGFALIGMHRVCVVFLLGGR